MVKRTPIASNITLLKNTGKKEKEYGMSNVNNSSVTVVSQNMNTSHRLNLPVTTKLSSVYYKQFVILGSTEELKENEK